MVQEDGTEVRVPDIAGFITQEDPFQEVPAAQLEKTLLWASRVPLL